MSSVNSLCLSLIFSCINSLARLFEFAALYWFSRCRWLFRIVFSFFATLCAGAVLLLTTGLMGMLGLCSFSRALSLGGEGFFWIRNFISFLSTILSHFCSALRMAFWSLSVGLFERRWKLFSARKA